MVANVERTEDNEYSARGYRCRHCLHWEQLAGVLNRMGLCYETLEHEDRNAPACERFDYGHGWADEYAKGARW